MKNIISTLILVCLVVALGYSQGERKVVQFTGLVVEGDSMLAIPGAFVFVPSSGRGASTNLLGYFSFPVNAGDTVVVAAVGYKKEKIKVPSDTSIVSLIVHLSRDTFMLPVVEIIAFPIERVFKEAFLAMNLPEDGRGNMAKTLNDQIMGRILNGTGMDGNANHSYYMQQQLSAMESRYLVRSSALIDPFSWARFFKSVKKDNDKKEQEKQQQIMNAPY